MLLSVDRRNGWEEQICGKISVVLFDRAEFCCEVEQEVGYEPSLPEGEAETVGELM